MYLCSQTHGNVYTETAEVGPLHLENRLIRITTAISLHFDKLYAHRSQTGRALYVKLAQTTKDGPDKAMLTYLLQSVKTVLTYTWQTPSGVLCLSKTRYI